MKNDAIKRLNHLTRRDLLTILGTTGAFGLLGFSKAGNTAKRKSEILTEDSINKMNSTKMKTIGILGGLGPQATMDLEARIHLVAQQLITPMQNGGYPPMMVYYHRRAPFLLNEDFSLVMPPQPDPQLLEAAKRLGSMTDFLIIPSNGVHMIQKEIEQASGRKVLSIIDATLDEVKKRQWKNVGVLGFKNAHHYTGRLDEMNIRYETIDEDLQARLDLSIMRVMEGRNGIEDRDLVVRILKKFRDKKVDGIIPGCTEIPLMIKEDMSADDIVNPAELLAKAAVAYAIV